MPLDDPQLRPADAVLKRPNVFLVGAMKAGTTSAYASLETSAEVFTPQVKEPHHFSTDLHNHPHTLMRRILHSFPNARFVESRRAYLNLYAKAPPEARYIIDASTSYLYSTDAAANIFAFAPDAKIVILLRDPVSRAWSEYKMNQFIGLETDRFQDAIRRERRRLDLRGTLLYKRYLLAGLYAEQVARYLRLFPREQVFIDVIDRPGEGFEPVLRRLARFLGLPEGAVTAKHENEAQAPFNSLINSALYYSGVKATISRLTPRSLKALAKGSYYAPIQSWIPPAERDFIAPFFEDGNRRLAELTGLDLRHWIAPKDRAQSRARSSAPAGTTVAARTSVALVRNSAIANQWSMRNSADYIARTASSDFDVRIHDVPVALSAFNLGFLRKYFIYFDVYVLGAIKLGLATRSADLVVSVDQAYAAALWLVPRKKRTAFVHDVIAICQARGMFPAAPTVGFTGRLYQKWILSALKSAPVLAVNTSIVADLLRQLGVTAMLVEVGQPAAGHRLITDAPEPDAPRRPYLLHVGGDTWIKNKAYLIAVYAALVARTKGECPDLVLAGVIRKTTMARITAFGLQERVRLVRSPSDRLLARLLSGCAALIMASVTEGFGVPPLEALLFDKPVFLSDNSVFRQIYGQVAQFFPLDEPEVAAERIADALGRGVRPPEAARLALLDRFGMEAVGARIRAWLTASVLAAEPDAPRASTRPPPGRRSAAP